MVLITKCFILKLDCNWPKKLFAIQNPLFGFSKIGLIIVKTQEEVLKIWIFQSICLKWHAAEKLKQPQSNMSYTYLSLIPLRMRPWKKYPPSWCQVTTLSYTIYVYLVPTYPILHWRLANSHFKRNRIGLESDVIWWSHPKSLYKSPAASYFYWCTGEPIATAVIIITFLLLSKALFQAYWRTAIHWGWSEKSPGSSSSLKYCRRRGSNHCPLAWELGTLPLDQEMTIKAHKELHHNRN